MTFSRKANNKLMEACSFHRLLVGKDESLSCLSPLPECLCSLSHARLTKEVKSLWQTVTPCLDWWGQRLEESKVSKAVIFQSRAHARVYNKGKGWVQYVWQSKRKRTDLKTARQHQWLWHRSWLDGCELVLFAPLGKSVLTLTSCYADMNVKTLKLSKQAYCMVWGKAL